MNTKEYLGRAVVCRVMYVELFQQACAVLPPTVSGEQELEVSYTLRDLAEKLCITLSQATMDVRRLENWGWVEKRKGSWRFLGRRVDGRFSLLADVAAQQMTGEVGLVSREILNVTLTAPDADPTARGGNLGTRRQWQDDESYA